ncbi:MAG: D-amino-acid transaminase [Sporolactobacillus sp.]|nr:D-amino-acid transaminase [Sporolactobacillus sp.]
MSSILYQDRIIPRHQGKVDIEDRGYQFGDGIYEAVHVYAGKLFLLGPHMKRLKRSASELRLQLPYGIDRLTELLQQLVEANHVNNGTVYFQITRGSAPRRHNFPEHSQPVVTGTAVSTIRNEDRTAGIRVCLADDIRWLRCDIKTLNLLGNVLANQKAIEQGYEEAILHRGDIVTEGSSSNVFIVKDGHLLTHPADHFILNGITRQFVIGLADQAGIPVDEQAFTTEELLGADEVFITSTGHEIAPVIEIDGHRFSNGSAGKVTRKLIDLFNQEIRQIKATSLS